jgi:hypothetical protein
VKLFGPDYDKLHQLGDALAGELKDVKGLVDLYDGHEHDAPELKFIAKHEALARLRITPVDLSTQLQNAIQRFDRLIGIRVRFPTRCGSIPNEFLTCRSRRAQASPLSEPRPYRKQRRHLRCCSTKRCNRSST